MRRNYTKFVNDFLNETGMTAECDYLDRLAQALLDADTRADKLTELRKMFTFATMLMGDIDYTKHR